MTLPAPEAQTAEAAPASLSCLAVLLGRLAAREHHELEIQGRANTPPCKTPDMGEGEADR